MAEQVLEVKQVKPQENLSFDKEKQKKKDNVKKIIIRTIVYILLTAAAISCLFPFYWMIISALKTKAEYEEAIPTLYVKQFAMVEASPGFWVWANFHRAFTYENGLFTTTLINSLIVGIVSTILSTSLTILSAYAFAKMEFHGKNLVFSILLATMMIPGELFTITNFVTANNMGWKNTYLIMILPFLCSIYYIYLLRNSFKSIPDSLYKAAKVDGCSDIKYLLKVMVPLSAPTIISISILKMIGTWNAYIWPELVNDPVWQLVSNWMTRCGTDANGDVSIPVRMAASMVISIPLFIVFVFFRKYIMRGVSKSGIKG